MKVFGIGLKSDGSQRLIGYLAFAVGGIVAMGGVFGLWMQGRIMYDGTSLHMIADVLCPEDIYASICLPSLVITIGGLLLSWAFLSSKLTEKLSPTRKNALFGTFAVVFLVSIMFVSKIATDQDWARASAAADEYFRNLQTNAPTSSPHQPEKARQ